MVTPDNHNKYYRMIEESNGTFKVEYGRIGANASTRHYSIGLWRKKYTEKIKKGYKDVSELHSGVVQMVSGEYGKISDRLVAELVDKLLAAAKKSIKMNYRVSWENVTPEMISSAHKVLENLANTSNVQCFNKLLLELFAIIPRKMTNVNENTAVNKQDFVAILERETELLRTEECRKENYSGKEWD